jgi:hypothetical protein
VVVLVALFGAGHGGAVASEFVMITGPVRPDEAGTAVSAGGACGGIGGAVATAVITPILLSKVIVVGPAVLPAATGYAGAWVFGAALAGAGAVLAGVLPQARSARRGESD